MAGGNAHANRHGHRPDCIFCSMRPKEARRKKVYRNSCHGSRNHTGKSSGGVKKKNPKGAEVKKNARL